MATRDVFSQEELEQLRRFPDIDRAELIRYFTLTPADEAFVRQFRGQVNVLGAAVQPCALPWLGFVPDEVTAAPAPAVARLPERLGVPVGELRGYGARGQTRTEHLRQVVAYSGWRGMDAAEWKGLDEFLFARTMEHDSPKLLFRLACEYLVSSRVVRPGAVNVLEHVATARSRAREETWTRTEHLLSEHRRVELDGLLVPDPELGRTRLSWLGVGPTAATPGAVKAELEKLAFLRRIDAHTLDLSVLPAERRRFWPRSAAAPPRRPWPGASRSAGTRSCSRWWRSRRSTCWTTGYDVTRLAFLLSDLPVELLGRLRSDRTFHFPAAAVRRDGKPGRPPKHGPEFKLPDPTTHPEPDAHTVTDTTRYGTARACAWKPLHPRLTRRDAWKHHEGPLPIVEGSIIRLHTDRLLRQSEPETGVAVVFPPRHRTVRCG